MPTRRDTPTHAQHQPPVQAHPHTQAQTPDNSPSPQPPPVTAIIVEHLDSHIHIRLPGSKFDGNAVRELFETAMHLIDQRNLRLLVDLTSVQVVTSGAMGMFVTIRKRFLQTGGQLHIAAPDPQVMEPFIIMHLQRMLNLFDNVDDAIANFK